MAELVIRVFLPSFYVSLSRNAAIGGGYVYAREIKAAYRNAESGLLLRLRTNSLGFRDADRPLAKQPGVMDIVVLGNSFVAAHQLPERDRFTERLEEKISVADRKVRVFNFGVQGQSLVNHMDLALFAERAFSPDLVVLFLTVDADFNQDAQATFRDNRRISYAVESGRGVRKEDEIGQGQWLFMQARRWMYGLWLGRIAHQTYQRVLAWLASGDAPKDAALIASCPSALQRSGASQGAFLVTETIVAEIHQMFGDRLLVALLPTAAQVHMDENTLDCDWTFAERWLDTLAKRRGFSALSLLPALRSRGESTFFPGGHLNNMGHEAVAQDLFAWLQSRSVSMAGNRFSAHPVSAAPQ